MSDQWEEGRRQLKISRARLAKRKLADSAKEVLKTTNLGRTTIANARAVTGRTANIPVKNMKTSMALEKPPSTLSKITRGALRIGGLASLGYLAFTEGQNLYNTLKQTHNEARQYAKHRGKRHKRKAQIPKAKHASKIIDSAVPVNVQMKIMANVHPPTKKNRETMDRWYNSNSRINRGNTWGRNRNYKKSYENYQSRLRRGEVTPF
tara:strand:+ start:648 stop:1268 length:621 start_codon:yes stop_codon:yes gene_type:complete